MGMIAYALVGNYKRFYNDLKEISKKNGKSPLLMFADTALCTLLLGSGLQDYLNYKFYEKSFAERKTYVSIGYRTKVYKTLASDDYAEFMSNKANFHKNYSEFVKRSCISCENTYEEFEEFLKNNKYFVYKPLRGLAGTNVKKMCADEIESKEELFKQIKDEKILIEELIVQDDTWGKLSPNSINTIRVVTTNVDDNVKIIFAGARIGSGKSIADNFHQGGQGVLVDTEKGVLVGNGIDKALNESEYSITGIKFDGFVIPYWEEIKEMVTKASKVNPNVYITGWDVAISKEHGPLLIEGNRGSGFDLIQVLLKKGTKYMLSDLMKEVKASQKRKKKEAKNKK